MKRLINTTTILSLALYVVPPFAGAQEFPKVMIDGTEVICLPDKAAVCPEGAFCVVVKKEKNCEVKAAEALAAAAADKAATEQAAADADAAAAKAAADAAAAEQAATDKAAADAAAAEQAAAEQAAADAAAAATAAAAAEQTAVEKAATEAAAAEQAAADKAAADAAAEATAAAEAAAAEAAAAAAAAEAEQAAADAAAADATAASDKADEAVTAATTTVEATGEVSAEVTGEVAGAVTGEVTSEVTVPGEAGFPMITVGGINFVCLPDKAAVCPEGAECIIAKTVKRCEVKAEAKVAEMAGSTPPPESPVVTEVPEEDAAAVAAALAAAAAAAETAAADPNATTIEAPVPTDEALQTLEAALDTPTASEEPVEAPNVDATPVVVDGDAGQLPADLKPSDEATVTTEVVTEGDSRDSTEEFDAAPATVAPGKKTGLSDFEKVGLIALGALVIGAIIKGNRQVVSNSGDRVVVRQPDGSYVVYKDDNALLREPGSTVRTETFADGSTRTIVQRTDGSQIVTIRDATGRVLQRVAYDRTGHGTVLIDDLQPEVHVDVTTLPRVEPGRNQISLDDNDASLRAQLAAASAADLGRKFSLRQIRNIPEVRYLAPSIDVNSITFETGSSAIQESQAKKLNSLGKLIVRLIKENPGEVFLIEGHTDAVGSAASNLALSDRRAESVAKALSEYFDVPPANLVVQGYGESELRVDTLGDERMNRRAAVRIITGLLRQNAL